MQRRNNNNNNPQQQGGGGRGGGYDNRGGGSYHRDRDRDRGRDNRGGGQQQRDRDRDRDRGGRGGGGEVMFGIVISLKEVFGFLQPFLPVPGEEHLYFTRGQEGPGGLQEGDEVQFHIRTGPRGLVATNVRRLEGGVKE